MVTITLKGREIPLLYTTWEMKQVQEELGPISTAIKKVLGRNPEDENDMSLYAGAEHLAAAATLIRILGNAGLEEKGQEPDLTEKWIMRNMKPAMIVPYAVLAMREISEGNKMETPDREGEKGPVDEGLEEQQAKKQQGS